MGVATERETWVGRAVPRIEDETLLRGERAARLKPRRITA